MCATFETTRSPDWDGLKNVWGKNCFYLQAARPQSYFSNCHILGTIAFPRFERWCYCTLRTDLLFPCSCWRGGVVKIREMGQALFLPRLRQMSGGSIGRSRAISRILAGRFLGVSGSLRSDSRRRHFANRLRRCGSNPAQEKCLGSVEERPCTEGGGERSSCELYRKFGQQSIPFDSPENLRSPSSGSSRIPRGSAEGVPPCCISFGETGRPQLDHLEPLKHPSFLQVVLLPAPFGVDSDDGLEASRLYEIVDGPSADAPKGCCLLCRVEPICWHRRSLRFCGFLCLVHKYGEKNERAHRAVWLPISAARGWFVLCLMPDCLGKVKNKILTTY